MHETTDALLGQKMDEIVQRFDSLEDRLSPLFEAYDSVLFGKKFLVGMATVVGAIAVIGGVVISAVGWLKHG